MLDSLGLKVPISLATTAPFRVKLIVKGAVPLG